MKKHLLLLITGSILFWWMPSCKKTSSDSLTNDASQQALKEEVMKEPVTPLNKPIALPASAHAMRAGNTPIPVIMVHGLGGFGPDEMGSFNYWGGVDDIPAYLTSNGHPAYAAAVGPFSSNFDRAVELYYYIKGGYVDYGKFHSSKYGHAQKKSRYYPGIYPQWDAAHPVHLLGHSMGGITVRKLVTLLEQGDALEKQDPQHPSLFSGGKTGWVTSVTTISTPHNGATLTYQLLPGQDPAVRKLVTAVAALAGANMNIANLYDFDLEQWGLVRQPNESFSAYMDRVCNSQIWTTEDYCGHDVTPEYARDWNSAEPDSKNVYYFSISTKATWKGLLTGWAYPQLTMFPLVVPVAYPWPLVMGIGNYRKNIPGQVIIDEKWWPNDGAANVYGMSGPATSIIKEYDAGTPLQKGEWHHLGLYNGYDHFAIIGMGLVPYNVRPFFSSIADFLQAVE